MVGVPASSNAVVPVEHHVFYLITSASRRFLGRPGTKAVAWRSARVLVWAAATEF